MPCSLQISAKCLSILEISPLTVLVMVSRLAFSSNVQQYEAFMEALRRTSPMPIVFGLLAPDTDGLCSFTRQTITIREGMSEVQTVCAAGW